jgi:hypothetical protein
MDARTIAELAMVAAFVVWLLAATVWVVHALVNHIRHEAKDRAKGNPGIFTNEVPSVPPAVPQKRMWGIPVVCDPQAPADAPTLIEANDGDGHRCGWNAANGCWRRRTDYRGKVWITMDCREMTLTQAQEVGRAVENAVYLILDAQHGKGDEDAR